MGNNSVHSDEAIENLEKLTEDTSNGAKIIITRN